MRKSQGNSSLSPVKQFVAPKSPFSIILRIIFIGCSLVASAALAFVLTIHAHSAAHADPTLIQRQVPAINQSYGSDPWDIKFDKSGHVFVAEPQCDVNVNAFPVCSMSHQSGIIEYSVSGFSSGAQPQILVEPPGYTSPFFLAFDGSGNLWFTEPVSNSIGEYDTGGNWHQWTVPTAQASPLDLTFDQYGHLWFTELGANQIGEFDPVAQTFHEYPTPNSRPYGITGPDPTTNSIWFTENNGNVHRIGQITPNSDGTIKNNHINEYLTNIYCAGNNCITPHLITYDKTGDIWWSEGYDGAIGELVISKAADGTYNGVTEYPVPLPNCPLNSNCATHISGIGVDSNGVVWFDDALSSRYGSFTPSNPPATQFNMYIIGGCVTNNTHPHDGLTVDSNNNVWFSQEFANTLAEAQPGTVSNPTPCSTPSPAPSPTVTTTPTPNLQPGPVNKTWYFAEGRAGGHFNEYLSLDNPTNTLCAVNIEYLYTPDRGTAQIKNVLVNIPANQRYEEGVDGDLGTSPNGSGVTDSAIVTVNTGATPNCAGIVAERPMYFNALGTNSGSDVLGVAHLGTTFYIADVAVGSQQGGGSYSSFIPILNPPTNTQSATVTATYYLNGVQVGQQQTVVPVGTRGTIFPNSYQPALPAHVSVVVTSTQPVAVERPTYFSNINGGNAGTVSGGADVIAVQSLSNDWLFAEGYTGGQFQENFVIANLDTGANTPANVTIKLEPQNGGSVSTFTITVPPLSQTIWNVNTLSHLPGQSLSAEIISTNAKIVVEREMFFRYLHNANGRSLSSTGGSDVLGQVGPAAQNLYSFAEGYVNVGYDEWLTLQNPTSNQESVWITLYNAVGTTYTYMVTVGPNSRATQDIVYVVLHNLYHSGDGYKGFEVSMTVQTTSVSGGPIVVERPMYWNVSGTQGGSDIIGYTGG
jgi:streptogramin lyase